MNDDAQGPKKDFDDGIESAAVNNKDKLFAIGDIHGCAQELKLLINQLPLDFESTVVFVGDFIDRGNESKEVIETILELKNSVHVVTLKGNHEDMLLGFLEDPTSEKAGMFIYNGGATTLASYSADSGKFEIPEEHLAFFKSLRLFHQIDDYFFVHAGVPPNVSLQDLNAKEHTDSMLWIREPFLKSNQHWESKIVHGHTPYTQVQLLPNRINLDTGCVYNQKLSAVGLPSQKVYSVPRRESEEDPIFLRDLSSNRLVTRFQGDLPVRIDHEGHTFHFRTLDYSNFGIYIQDESKRDTPLFKNGDRLKGKIGSDLANQAPFEGRVVRVDSKPNGFCYALQMKDPVLTKGR